MFRGLTAGQHKETWQRRRAVDVIVSNFTGPWIKRTNGAASRNALTGCRGNRNDL